MNASPTEPAGQPRPGVTLRPGTPRDAIAIEAVRKASWQSAYGHLLPPTYFAGWDVADRATRRAPRPEARWIVAEDEAANLVGYVCHGPSRDLDLPDSVGEIWALYVRPERFSTGVGRVLTTGALAALARSGHTDAALWVLADNPRARRFYAKAGFRPDGAERPIVIGDVTLSELRLRVSTAVSAVSGPS